MKGDVRAWTQLDRRSDPDRRRATATGATGAAGEGVGEGVWA